MDKLQMAHDWAMKIIEGNTRAADACDLIEREWQYANAMQAEADKRKPSGLPEALKEECQSDWSQAPEWANWWAMDKDGEGFYFENKPMIGSATWLPVDPGNMKPSPTFNYQGDWKDSLRKRPQ